MRTDVKLGVIFALVMVLAAGGYFMFRGEKQTPISLSDKAAGPEIKTQPTKPGSAAKPAANQPKPPTTTTNRPTINPAKPMVNNANTPARPVAPVVTPPVNKPAITPPAGLTDGSANPVLSRPTNPPPSAASPSPADAALPPVSSSANPTAIPAMERPIPVSTAPSTNPAVSAPTAAPAAPATGREVGLMGIPNSHPASSVSSPAANLSPLANRPSSPVASAPSVAPSTTPATAPAASSSLPPGIRTTNVPMKSDSEPAKKNGVADAAVETHKVQVGDSLSSLAQTYYGSPKYAKFLADSNPKLGDPDRLKVGSLVSIPPLPTESDARTAGGFTPTSSKPGDKPAADGKRTYTVKAGDSFYSIAKSQLGSASRWKELLALNNATVNGDPTSLQPGQRLVLPETH